MIQKNQRIKSKIDTMINAKSLTLANKSKLRVLGLDYMEDNWKKRILLCMNLTSTVSINDYADIAGSKNGLHSYIPKCEAIIERLKDTQKNVVLEESLDEVIQILNDGVNEYKELYAQIDTALNPKKDISPEPDAKPDLAIDVHSQIAECLTETEQKYYDHIKNHLHNNLRKITRCFDNMSVDSISLSPIREVTSISAFSKNEIKALFLNVKRTESGFKPRSNADSLIDKVAKERSVKYIRALNKKLNSNFLFLEENFGSMNDFEITALRTEEQEHDRITWSATFESDVEMSGSFAQQIGHRQSEKSDRLDQKSIASSEGFDKLSAYNFSVDRLKYINPETKTTKVIEGLHPMDLSRVSESLRSAGNTKLSTQTSFPSLSN